MLTIKKGKITYYYGPFDAEFKLYTDLELFKKELKEFGFYNDLDRTTYMSGKHVAFKNKNTLYLFAFAGCVTSWVHEISHCVTTLMKTKGISDDEFRSYTIDFLFTAIFYEENKKCYKKDFKRMEKKHKKYIKINNIKKAMVDEIKNKDIKKEIKCKKTK